MRLIGCRVHCFLNFFHAKGDCLDKMLPFSIVSARKCREELGGDAKTPYGWHFSSDGYAYAVLAFSAVAFVYAVITLVLSFM